MLGRSTSGLFLAFAGPHSFFPLAASSKKQTAVSHSTPEAEIVAADAGLRTLGFPGMDLWDRVLAKIREGKPVPVEFMEDTESTIDVINSGKNIKKCYQNHFRILAMRKVSFFNRPWYFFEKLKILYLFVQWTNSVNDGTK